MRFDMLLQAIDASPSVRAALDQSTRAQARLWNLRDRHEAEAAGRPFQPLYQADGREVGATDDDDDAGGGGGRNGAEVSGPSVTQFGGATPALIAAVGAAGIATAVDVSIEGIAAAGIAAGVSAATASGVAQPKEEKGRIKESLEVRMRRRAEQRQMTAALWRCRLLALDCDMERLKAVIAYEIEQVSHACRCMSAMSCEVYNAA